MYVDETVISTGMMVGQSLVVKAQDVKYCRVKVVECHRVFGREVTDIVCLAMSDPPFHAATGQPDREPIGVVISTVCALGDRCSSELRCPVDECVIQQAGDWPVHFQSVRFVVLFELGMLIPLVTV